jgi:succinate dehydrogenase/fumarate reductase flavoprotein subunit
MTKTYDYDLFVIGAGSGGVRAARVAAGMAPASPSPRNIRSAAPA